MMAMDGKQNMGNDVTLPEGWRLESIGGTCQILPGYGFPKSLQGSTKGSIPFYKVGDISANVKSGARYLESCENYVDSNALSTLKAKLLPPNSIVFAKIGEGLKLNRRAITKLPSLIDNNAIGIKARNLVIDDLFLFHFLTTIKLEALSQATTVPSVRKSDIENITIPLPPLPEQERIVSKIEELFSELEKGKEQILLARQQLKTYRQAVLKWAFEGRLTNAEVEDGVLPEGWEWVKVENAAESLDNLRKPINKTERAKRVGTIPYYGANGRTGWINDYLFNEPLILVVEDETFTGRELPFSYKISGKSWVNNHAHILRAKENCHIDFLNYQLAYYPFLPLTTGTTGRKKLTKKALMNAIIKICPLPEQHRIVQEIESRLSVCNAMEATLANSLAQAEVLRQSILKRAFEGRLV
ncbi:MAG: restriction endonuclease subunit S [Bacteroidia bacterium]